MKALRVLRKTARYFTSLALLLMGGLGLAVAAVNPLEFLTPFLRTAEQVIAQNLQV